MPDLRIHDLRHSFASTAIMDNLPLATIGKLLGHLLPETTAKYAHLSDDVIADAAQRISGSLAEAIGLRHGERHDDQERPSRPFSSRPLAMHPIKGSML